MKPDALPGHYVCCQHCAPTSVHHPASGILHTTGCGRVGCIGNGRVLDTVLARRLAEPAVARCLNAHRLPSASIPCGECVAKTTADARG